MSQQIVPYQRKNYLREDGILFVRTEGILETMAKIPLLIASLVIVTAIMPLQSSFSSPRTLDLIIYPDGSTHVYEKISVDPLASNYELELFGSTIDNFVAVGENGFLLSSELIGDFALIETFGSSEITVEYDIHDLVSKQGRVWTFNLDSPSEFTLLLPKNSAIVGMTNLPIDMQLINNQNQITLPSGETEIDYLFSIPSDTIDNSTPDSSTNSDNLIYAIFGGVAAAGIIGIIAVIRSKQKTVKPIDAKQTIQIPQKHNILNPEIIFKLKPDIREDDKEIVKFIFDNGGQVLESDLRKKFLQPRTTMWRAVKRLERNGIIEIEKKDLQNMVKLRKNMEEEE